MDIAKSSRFKDAPWFSEEQIDVLVGGAGGIGSWLTLLLTRAGYHVHIYDYDLLEEHNMGGQLYGEKHIGTPKVEALATIVNDFTSCDIHVYNEKYDDKSPTNTFVFCAYDNMQARKDTFNNWVIGVAQPWLETKEGPKPIFIDGRLTMEQIQIFCVTPENIDKYEKEHLFDDSEVEEAPCTLKQTSHSAAMIGSMMVGFFTNHLTSVLTGGEEERVVPFFFEYFIPLNMVNEEN